ncbi:unnamed protein product [Cryptosporidium hominis]|uniref:Uncharacterized protein n=1 Tax=Cryptosporidium hominis TaxID=237895 RepID=A0A0S4TGB6_CRYHO|nr:hypothetical protein [Cryptosporidium hominis TU502]OLQ16751.1 hypothetical protein ChTU502y2012_386g0130 [Cryptosporidium hominis]PPA63833.1 hypothetical protein ChUKH1_06260 [Cryptosporidium hominis]PPS93480.1 Uncharacterized protein GY17_00003599 [Cryptosporidium hominis]CUV06140.1 unnamed protein product [Cryptosporidium hominis]|eukprot:PPS93480.1 Uncharacterized protein GY17_00003599 [Cryptosporidium hominis]
MKLLLSSIFLILCVFTSGTPIPTPNEIVLAINNNVKHKYPNIEVPLDWQSRVFIKYYPEESSIKVHCPVENDAPFGRTLIRNLFRIYKRNFPSDKRIKKMKLSFQSPSGEFITAEKLSIKGYLSALNELVEDLIEEDIENEVASSGSPILPNTKLSISSLSSLSDSNVQNYPVYVFFTNEEERLKQEGMVQLLVQLGFNVAHTFGNATCNVDSTNYSVKIPEILSPTIDKNINTTFVEENPNH